MTYRPQEIRIRKKQCRFKMAGLFILLAAVVNLLLFYALSWINKLPRRLPALPQYTVIEVLPPQPQADTETIQPDIPQSFAEVRLDKPQLQPMQAALFPTPDFQPRLQFWQPQSLSGIPDIEAVSVTVAATNSGPHSAGSNNGVYSLAQVDQPPQKMKTPPPAYPYWARRSDAQGSVELRFLVSKQGTVGRIEIIRSTGNQRFINTATKTVKKWLFKPTTFNGRAVNVWCNQIIQFKMDDWRNP